MYQIGQICIGQHMVYSVDRNGMECEIIKPLHWVEACRIYGTDITTKAGLKYTVKWADGKTGYARPDYLRPKHEPGSWDDEEFKETLNKLGWRPYERVN